MKYVFRGQFHFRRRPPIRIREFFISLAPGRKWSWCIAANFGLRSRQGCGHRGREGGAHWRERRAPWWSASAIGSSKSLPFHVDLPPASGCPFRLSALQFKREDLQILSVIIHRPSLFLALKKYDADLFRNTATKSRKSLSLPSTSRANCLLALLAGGRRLETKDDDDAMDGCRCGCNRSPSSIYDIITH